MTDTLNLKPCPFCGAEAKIAFYPGEGGWIVSCVNYHAEINNPEDKQAAIKQWNSRAPVRSEIPVVDVAVLENDIAQAETQLKSLCNSGGRTWALSIPVRSYDTDIVYANVIRHAKTLLAYAKAQPVRESVVLSTEEREAFYHLFP